MSKLMLDLASQESVPACAGAAAGWPCGEVGPAVGGDPGGEVGPAATSSAALDSMLMLMLMSSCSFMGALEELEKMSKQSGPTGGGAATGWPCVENGWPCGEVAGAAAGWPCVEAGIGTPRWFTVSAICLVVDNEA